MQSGAASKLSGVCPDVSRRSTRVSRSRCSSTTRTRRTRWNASCTRRAGSPTPASRDRLLHEGRELPPGRLLCVFGCGGDRDRGKRPLMGRVASELADVAIVTSDNPRSEEPEAIIAEILEGAGDAEADPDRREAIARAIGEADEGDVVVIAGKGHEQGQQFADRTIPFDVREVAREALRRLGAAA